MQLIKHVLPKFINPLKPMVELRETHVVENPEIEMITINVRINQVINYVTKCYLYTLVG